MQLVLKRKDLSGANLTEADLAGADLSRANLSGANLSGVNLTRADLTRANLTEANLSGADLYGADLIEANLTEADLTRADLTGANLSHTKIIGFYCGKHFGFIHTGDQYYSGNYCKIGCEGQSLQEWLEYYNQLGQDNEYSDVEIQLYGNVIKFWAKQLNL